VGTPVDSKIYTADEIQGLALFNTTPDSANKVVGAGCALCHPVPFTGAALAESVFTDFSYDNLGIPKNPAIATLAGPQDTDYGLGAQVAILETVRGQGLTTFIGNESQPVVTDEAGKFKVSSLRNVAKTAPYGHNGFFKTLLDIVHFYNTRDVSEEWADPEVPRNVNDSELGNLNLTSQQEEQIVAFLETLTDGYFTR
jgi:cytochrome c peroxidase